jgi:hypothetical protein
MYTPTRRLLLIVLLLLLTPLMPAGRAVLAALAAGPNCSVNPAGGATYTTIQAAIADAGCATIMSLPGHIPSR